MRATIDYKVIEAKKHISQEEILKEFETVQDAVKDPAKFQIIYDRYFIVIFNYIFRKIDDEDITADLTSQTFLKALKNLKKYKYKGVPFSAWLYRIASNEVNRHYLQANKKVVFSFDEQEFENLIEQHTEKEKELDIDYIIQQMQSLSESDIEVLELRFFESKSFAEIAFILEINEATLLQNWI
ncbi:MAG: sigma-70 family RNA polymerase sigma factor [Cyclobacteriaceae bacterium]|nr:sigma-70 family RNA polymerase sigma factor [Cyclobacteriaceae bacterium]